MPDTPPPNRLTPDQTVHAVPLAHIDAGALPRDRAGVAEDRLEELRRSIAANGLRLPIEVFAMKDPTPPLAYGLISGMRRLRAFRDLRERTGDDAYAAIPAFIRAPRDAAAALAAMVEENEIRAGLSPWERGRVAVAARDAGTFATIEEAVERLYPAADRSKRARLRAAARVTEALEDALTAPETLSLRQILRLSAALTAGWLDLIRAALEEASDKSPDAQWRLLAPILDEAEAPPPRPMRPGRPKRLFRHRGAFTVRREKTKDGYALHFTGKAATSGVLDTLFDEIEARFAPE